MGNTYISTTATKVLTKALRRQLNVSLDSYKRAATASLEELDRLKSTSDILRKRVAKATRKMGQQGGDRALEDG